LLKYNSKLMHKDQESLSFINLFLVKLFLDLSTKMSLKYAGKARIE